MSAATLIDPLARVAPGAQLGSGVVVGPFCSVGPDVTLCDGVVLRSHVVVDGKATIGPRTEIHAFASIGGPPQDLSYRGEPTEVIVGADCIIRESVTINRGSQKKGMTRVGDRCFMMALSHVAHDCTVGDQVIFANGATLGGHVEVGTSVFLGGLCGVHQHSRIGDFAMVGGLTGVKEDIIPFGMAFGANGVSGELIGINVVGMKRRGVSRDDLRAVKSCYDALFYASGTFAERLAAATSRYADHPVAGRIIAFLAGNEKRPIMMAAPRRTRAAGIDG